MMDYHFFEDILMYLCDNICVLVQHNKKVQSLDLENIMFLMSLSRHKIENGSSYQKMIYKHHRYATMAYCEKLKIDDSLVKLQSGSMGVITNVVVGNISATKVITMYIIIQLHSKI
uniref:Uncharacterized protein n=1 Tax=Trichogramma kaykai TaxID=54128 RepID=A0ABD2W9K9_9HYME